MTAPTPDAAKLLPCPFCGEPPVTDNVGENGRALMIECETEHCGVQPHVSCYDRRKAKEWWNTRPQPAPPEGEPDELDAILARAGWALFDATKNYPIGCQSPGWVPECVEAQRQIAEYQRARRLGLAARPKVEDGEVAAEIALIDGFLAGTHGTDKESFRLYMKRWRDLLKRLSADLRTKETQLAQADACVVAGYEGCSAEYLNDAGFADVVRSSQKRHAARQQQRASAEPTTSKAGETR